MNPVPIWPKLQRLERMKRSTLTAARLMQVSRGSAVMVTLTYAESHEWARDQIKDFLKRVREWCRRRELKFRYVWVMELTKRARPHYHVLLFLPRGIMLPKPDKRGWWLQGMSRIERARNALGYLVAYIKKGGLLNGAPKGARVCGCGGLDSEARLEKAWWLSPGWVKRLFWPSDKPRRAPGGGVCARETGEWVPSPWILVNIGPEHAFIEIERAGWVDGRRVRRATLAGMEIPECEAEYPFRPFSARRDRACDSEAVSEWKNLAGSAAGLAGTTPLAGASVDLT